MIDFMDEIDAVYYIAKGFQMQHPQYEVNELVAEIWLWLHHYPIKYRKQIWSAGKRALWRYHNSSAVRDLKPSRYRAAKGESCKIDHITDYIFTDNRLDAVDIICHLFENLTDRQKSILAYRFQNCTDRETGKKMGCSRETVRLERAEIAKVIR